MVNSENTLLGTIGLNIRRIRTSSGLSQDQLAFEAGLSREYINKLEAGRLNISILNLERIATVLNASITELISDGRGTPRS